MRRKTSHATNIGMLKYGLWMVMTVAMIVAGFPKGAVASSDGSIRTLPIVRRTTEPGHATRRRMTVCRINGLGCPSPSALPSPTPKPTATPVPTSCSFNGITSPPNQSISANVAPPLTSGSVTVTCTNGAPYNIEMNPGLHGTDGSSPTRYVANGSNLLNYGIYSATCTCSPWGDTVGTNTVAATGNGAAQTYTVYVQFGTPGYNVPAGTYTDTVTVTIAY